MNSLTSYDSELQSKLDHLKIHSAYLPHIGLNYNETRVKTLIIAESHYLPKKHNNKFSSEDWYNNSEIIYKLLNEDPGWHKNWFNTRNVIKTYQDSSTLEKGHGIFNNLEKAYQTINEEVNLFEECVYLNYFQRPSEVEGDSINVHKIDSEIALKNLIVICEVLMPNKIIFVSSKAHKDFTDNVSKAQLEILPYVGSVPHPSASSWWNRKSKKYGLGGKAVTGREKFIRIMSPK
jgi:hypothetical protein